MVLDSDVKTIQDLGFFLRSKDVKEFGKCEKSWNIEKIQEVDVFDLQDLFEILGRSGWMAYLPWWAAEGSWRKENA